MDRINTISQIFENEGFRIDTPIPFGQVNQNKAIQDGLSLLKDYPEEEVINFIKKEVGKMKKGWINRRKSLKSFAKKNPEVVKKELKGFICEDEKQVLKEHDEIAERSIDRAIKWYLEHVIDKK